MEIDVKREYVPYWDWEEVGFNMWGSVDNREEMLQWAIEFTGDHVQYGEWMIKVVDQWPLSCLHNLSNKSQNRRAWVGHAACALRNRCPEDIVRSAWGKLNEAQQTLANMQADIAILRWEAKWAKYI